MSKVPGSDGVQTDLSKDSSGFDFATYTRDHNRLLKDTDNFVTRAKKGENLPFNSYRSRRFSHEWSMGSYKDTYTNFQIDTTLWSYWCGYARGLSHVNLQNMIDYGGLDAFPQAKAQATQRFYEAAKGLDLNAAVTLAEFPKTMQLIASTATRLGGAFRSLKRFDVPGAFRSLGITSASGHRRALSRSAGNAKRGTKSAKDFASNSWLELTYGWTPLVMDAYNVTDAMTQDWAASKKNPVLYVRGKGSEDLDPSSFLDISADVKPSSKAKGYVKIVGEFEVIDPTLKNLDALGLINPATVIWELVPYSFVVDWFVPIGDFLDAQTALLGLQYRGGSTTVTGRLSGGVRYDLTNHPRVRYTGFESDNKVCIMQRYVDAGVPSTLDMLSPKALDKIFSKSHVTTALALLNNAFR